jgi:hypothetical protein
LGAKRTMMVLLLVLAAAAGGVYYWYQRASSPASAELAQAPVAPRKAETRATPNSKPDLGHPLPGETVGKEQPFTENDYGFSMVLPAGWKVLDWTQPAPPEPGKRRPAYLIRLKDPRTGSILDFAAYPFTEKSRYAVEEIFISKIQAPIPGIELDIQRDEVVKQGDMRIRRAEMRTRDAQGQTGLMKTFYYLSNDKLYTFSLLGSEETFTSQGPAVDRLLDNIRILG